MAPIIGIDLGTTNSAVAYLSEDGPQIIVNSLGSRLTPSVVGMDPSGTLLVGSAAKELQVLHPERCASVFKRWMGSDRDLEVAGKRFSAEELSSLVLKSLKADAEAHFREPITRAVITVPAYFNDQQRKATITAGKIAGLTVERILNEPTAAALAYGFRGSKENNIILIFDLGGGTFDVSIVEQFEGAIEVRSSAGETSLGGEDFTRTLAARVLESVGLPFERAEATMPLVVSRVIQQCEKAKRQLTTEESVTVRVPNKKGELTDGQDVTITRQQMEEWIAPILTRIEAPIRRVLTDAKLTRDQIDDVILVGGATRMPVIVNRVKDLFRKLPHSKLNPDEVVALGAAVQAGLVEQNAAVDDLVVTDVSPFTLGIEIAKEISFDQATGYFDPIIDRNSVIPVSRVKRYSTVANNQTIINVRVFQGENRKVTENLLLAEFEVRGIPAGPAGQPVDIRFTYDLNGVLEVEATIVATKKKVTHIVAKHAKGLSEKQVKQAVEAMARLKLHPRDDAKNHYVLTKANRIYAELTSDARHHLSMLIDGFEMALESREPDAISQHRATLESFLLAYEPDEDGGHHGE